METYQTIVENPLIYYIDHTIYDNTNCYVIDDALKLKLYENIAFEDSIIHALERTENKAKENLTRQFHRLIEEDYPYAFLENQIYDLEKRKTKKYQA